MEPSADISQEPVWKRVRLLFELDAQGLYMDAGPAGARLQGIKEEDEAVCSTFAEVRKAVAPGFGCDSDEIVVTHSTTDALCKILAGLELGAGDEILTTNHEHYGGLAPMALARDRRGVVINRVQLPIGNEQQAGDYVDRFAAALTDRTKVVLFSAPTYTTGTMLPIRSLARLAQQHDCITVVDGAHLPGMLHRSFHAMGVDFLAGSGAKWQGGPPGTGLLYVRNKILSQYNPRPLPSFWPVVSVWYPPEGGLPPRTTTSTPSYDMAEYLQTTGSASRARMQAFEKACAMWDKIGRDQIEGHVLDLSAYLKGRIAEQWGIGALYSPKDDPRLVSAITSFNPFAGSEDTFDEGQFETFVTRLEREHGIVVRYTRFEVAGASRPHHGVRISTRPFHRRDDVDRLVDAMAQLAIDEA